MVPVDKTQKRVFKILFQFLMHPFLFYPNMTTAWMDTALMVTEQIDSKHIHMDTKQIPNEWTLDRNVQICVFKLFPDLE